MIVKNDLVLKSQWFKPRCRKIHQISASKLRWKIVFLTLKTSGNIWDDKSQRTITSRFHGRFNDTENDSHICIESELSPCQKHTYLIKVQFSQQWLMLERWLFLHIIMHILLFLKHIVSYLCLHSFATDIDFGRYGFFQDRLYLFMFLHSIIHTFLKISRRKIKLWWSWPF